ncbi:MAG: hypothetical protein H0T17_08435 [Propionibacteriales bacterium]|nr:hypothetical protein [Propionibacteriales bacterium]
MTVTLRRPPPLETSLRVQRRGFEVDLLQGDQLVASARPGSWTAPAPAPIPLEQAWAAEPAYLGLHAHPFPTCFVCGTGREPGDGLCLSPGLVGPGKTACTWTPDTSLALDGWHPAPEFVWSALDCPGGWTSDLQARPLVLGRMTASCQALPVLDQPHLVVGQLLGEDGRKTFTATALYDDERLLARAEHVWIAVDPATFQQLS